MEYLHGFRNAAAAAVLRGQITGLAQNLGSRVVHVMEVCGTHTMAIARGGLRSILPEQIDLISGPGCPVCVTDSGYIDAAIEIAGRGAIIATFGDMVRVPGSSTSLADCRAAGADVRVCYSPLEAISIAAENPDREVVFLGIGFETTIGPVISLIGAARKAQLDNLSILVAFKQVPPALKVLCGSAEVQIDAFLLPAHVSAVIGSEAYSFLPKEFAVSGVVAGFESLDILLAIKEILVLLQSGTPAVINQYSRVVRPQGNRKIQQLISSHLESADVSWRGLGVLPASGLALRPEFTEFDAAQRFKITVQPGREPAGCRCGEVLKGVCKPPQCKLFGTVCLPSAPIGPCMVSSEGSCAAYYRYEGAARK